MNDDEVKACDAFAVSNDDRGLGVIPAMLRIHTRYSKGLGEPACLARRVNM
jgi:hypothetical protein